MQPMCGLEFIVRLNISQMWSWKTPKGGLSYLCMGNKLKYNISFDYIRLGKYIADVTFFFIFISPGVKVFMGE